LRESLYQCPQAATVMFNTNKALRYLNRMARTEKRILGEKSKEIVDLLKKAYCDEMQIFHFFWYVGINMEGIGLVTYATSLKTQATGELTHGELLSNRISELEDKAPSNPSEWGTMSNIGSLDPLKHLTLRSALDKALEFEGKAVQNYNNIAKRALELSDFVTYNLATTILADEVKDEQHTEDVLKGLEVK
jgi:bacterioferritin